MLFRSYEEKYELLEAGLTTDAQGVLTLDALLPGSYRLLETASPEGYYLPKEYTIDFTIDIHGDIDVAEDGVIKIYNKKLGKVQIYKVDSVDHDIRLPGAEFILYRYDEETKKYEEYRSGLVSDEHGSLLIEGLLPGEYKLLETKSPLGYELPENPETLFTIVL